MKPCIHGSADVCGDVLNDGTLCFRCLVCDWHVHRGGCRFLLLPPDGRCDRSRSDPYHDLQQPDHYDHPYCGAA